MVSEMLDSLLAMKRLRMIPISPKVPLRTAPTDTETAREEKGEIVSVTNPLHTQALIQVFQYFNVCVPLSLQLTLSFESIQIMLESDSTQKCPGIPVLAINAGAVIQAVEWTGDVRCVYLCPFIAFACLIVLLTCLPVCLLVRTLVSLLASCLFVDFMSFCLCACPLACLLVGLFVTFLLSSLLHSQNAPLLLDAGVHKRVKPSFVLYACR